MAEKEATVYIVDLGRSMNSKHQGREQTDLDWSLQYVWDKITSTVYTGRKTANIGIIGLGTDETKNDMSSDAGYNHISIIQPLAQILTPDLRRLSNKLRSSQNDTRDVLSAIIIAIDMIMKHCRHLQYKKKIVVVTNATGKTDEDDTDSIIDEIKKNKIELIILGIDFDDAEYGVKEEKKSPIKAQNERILRKLADGCDGMIATMQEAIDGLSRPNLKPVRPTPTYTGQLILGNPSKYDTAFTIDVQRYFKTQIRRAPTASAFVVKKESQQASQHDNLTAVHNLQKYIVLDENGEQQEVPREELAKGYEYGRTAVHISESDQNITQLETEAGYEILGFIPTENVERYMVMDNSNMLVAQKGNDKAALALSSLIHALFELGSVAVCRFVKKDMTEPLLTVLSPLVEDDIECLIENVLPFAEDIRIYRFPPLDKFITVSGKTVTQHRNLPSQDLVHSMSEYVDNLTLIQEDEEIMPLDDTYSPLLHTIEGAVKYRAVYSGKDLPPKAELFQAYAKQPDELQARSKNALSKLVKLADVKKVPPKAKGRKRYREQEKPLSGLNVEDLFRKEKRTKISPENAIPEFKQTLDSSEDLPSVREAVQQMAQIIEEQTRSSFGDNNYDRVIEGLSVVRQEMLDLEEPDLFNNVIRQLKQKIFAEDLGGNRKELWWKIRVNKLGLIDSGQSTVSEISREEADKFMTSK